MTWPAAAVPSLPCKRISRVEATFKESLKRVVTKSTEGNTEKSKGFKVYMPVSRMIRAKEMLKESRISKRKEGKGRIMTTKMATTPAASPTSAMLLTFKPGRANPLPALVGVASAMAVFPLLP